MSGFAFPSERAGLTPLSEAQAVVDALASVVAANRAAMPLAPLTLPLHQCLGHRLAQDLIAPLDLPRTDNAAMDGYAFARADVQALPARLTIAAQVLAGAQPGALTPMTCVRIMTGARLPEGADAVLPLEEARLDAGALAIMPEQAAAATHVRHRGEELRAGAVALGAGTWLTPAALGLAAQLGLARLPVMARLRVAVVSCGDELQNPGEAMLPTGHFDGNRALLMAQAAQLGCEAIDGGIARDNLAATCAQFEAALQNADVLITTGGAGAGDADFARAALQMLGHSWNAQLALKPGKPFGLALIRDASASKQGDKIAMALPGNPVAALVAFEALASRALRILLERPPEDASRERSATLTHAIKAHPNRTEYLRAHFAFSNGHWQATVLPNQSSSMLTPQVGANGWVVVSPDGFLRFLVNTSAFSDRF